MSTALACRDVTVRVEGRALLDGVSLDVEHHEWLCILGPNGAGKTTLLRALTGLLTPERGHVEIMGSSVDGLPVRARARLVAVVPQVPVIPPGMRVLDYVLLGRTPYLGLLAYEGTGDVAVAFDALATLELEDLAERVVDSLSGGERQRVLVARALAQQTPVLLLDEPTTSLDIGHQQDVLELVDKLRRECDLTVVSTMHDLTLAGQYADRLVLLRDGRVVESGGVEDVMTEDNLARHFGARVTVLDGPFGPVVVPHRIRLREHT
jgi:cobalamin transport system ATP-binding protein